MKEATGELNMTVITVIAIAAVAALFYSLVWPTIQRAIVNNTCATYGGGWHAVARSEEAKTAAELNGNSAAKIKFGCCPEGTDTWSDTACTKD